ncbi:Glycosyl transferase family 31, partial [Trinorchestia longiramus]
ENINFLVAVMSSPIDFARRKMIRRTWGRPSELAVVQASLLFFVGRSTSKKVQVRTEAEAAIHRDIVQLDFKDDYDYLSTKTIYMMRWFTQFCVHAQWFVKTDVDALWNLYLLNSVLSSQNKQKTLDEYRQFWLRIKEKGNIKSFTEVNSLNHQKMLQAAKIVPKGLEGKIPEIICPKAKGLMVCRKPEYDRCEQRYVVTKEEYSSELYPPHCHGFGYAIHTQVVRKILHEDQERVKKGLPRFRMEDVYITGMLLNNTTVKIFDISGMTASSPRRWHPGAALLIHGPQRNLGAGSARLLWENMKYLHMLA